MRLDSCDICHGYCENFEIKMESGEDGWLAGADGCPTLNKYLRGYFIATKLLKQQVIQVAPNCSQIKHGQAPARKIGRPRKKRCTVAFLEEFIGRNDPVSKHDKLLYSSICGRCDKIVNEAVYLHQEKMKLHQRIERLGETLQEMQILADKVAREAEEAVELENQRVQEECSIKATQNQMLGLSLACLGKVDLPPRRTPKRNAPRKLRSRSQARKSDLDEEQMKLEPEPQDEAEDSPGDTFLDLEMDNQLQNKHQNTDVDPEINEEETTGATVVQNDENDDLDYEPNEEEVSNCSNDDSDSDFEPSPKKKPRKSTSNKKVEEYSSSDEDDKANFGEDDYDNFQIIVDEDDGSSTKLPFSTTECPEPPESPPCTTNDSPTPRNKLHHYQCEICSKKLFNSTSLHTHLTRIHRVKLQFNCPDCNQFFTQKGQLLLHRYQEHKVKFNILGKLPSRDPRNEEEEMWAKLPCGECGKVCLTGKVLNDHLRKTHEIKIPLKERRAVRKRCHFCTKRFYLEQRYFVHVKITHADKAEDAFRCDRCDVGFSTTIQLKQHYKQSHYAMVEGDSIHICDQCEWPFLDKSSLKTHSRVHNQVKTRPVQTLTRHELFERLPFKCWFCWESFPQKEKLDRHLKNNTRHKTLKVEFPCDVESCEYYKNPFEKLEELNEHLRSCHEDSCEILECQWCSCGFTSENMFALHKLNHQSPNNTYHYKCPLCDRICKKKVTLINHYNVVHELNLKPNKCPHCPERFVTLIAVNVHIKEEHSDLLDITKVLTCDQCGKICLNARALDSHVRNYHRDHTCSTCSKVFKTYELMRKHVKKDHDIVGPGHLCSLCGAAYSSSCYLRTHIEEVHKKPKFECQICHLKFKNKYNLKYHMRRIHDPSKLEKPPAPFVCKECGKGYSRKDSLDDHVRVKHSQDTWRVYTCDQCGKRFRRESFLTEHLTGKGCPKRLGAPVIIA